MTIDLVKQREYADIFAETLASEIGDDDITADLILDLLGCCGLSLREGEDAGKAWMDQIIETAKDMDLKEGKRQ